MSEEYILTLLEAGRWAPSGANLQPWHFVVVTDDEVKRKIAKYSRFYFIKSYHVSDVPVIIVVCADTGRSGWALVDGALAAQNIMLAAHALGLGSCFVGGFKEREVKAILNLPERFTIVGLITIGYTAEEPSVPPRLEIGEITSYNLFSGSGGIKERILRVRRSGPFSVFRKVMKIYFNQVRKILGGR